MRVGIARRGGFIFPFSREPCCRRTRGGCHPVSARRSIPHPIAVSSRGTLPRPLLARADNSLPFLPPRTAQVRGQRPLRSRSSHAPLSSSASPLLPLPHSLAWRTIDGDQARLASGRRSISPRATRPGAARRDMASESATLRAQLREFEARADASDPEHQKLLDVMREHIRGLERVRGDWNAPVGDRDWNAPPAQETTAAPLADEAYRYARKRGRGRDEKTASRGKGVGSIFFSMLH